MGFLQGYSQPCQAQLFPDRQENHWNCRRVFGANKVHHLNMKKSLNVANKKIAYLWKILWNYPSMWMLPQSIVFPTLFSPLLLLLLFSREEHKETNFFLMLCFLFAFNFPRKVLVNPVSTNNAKYGNSEKEHCFLCAAFFGLNISTWRSQPGRCVREPSSEAEQRQGKMPLLFALPKHNDVL